MLFLNGEGIPQKRDTYTKRSILINHYLMIFQNTKTHILKGNILINVNKRQNNL